MKKFLLTLSLVSVLALSSNAQFHIELGLNFNSPQGDFGDQYDLGVGFYAEPKYAINENIDLGLLIGRNGFAGADIGGQSIDAIGMTTILPTGTYRFSGGKVTPYAGLGLGVYIIDAVDLSITIDGNTTVVEGESSSEFGFAPRAGVYIGRLNLGAAYNIVSDANFIQFNLGVRILNRG